MRTILAFGLLLVELVAVAGFGGVKEQGLTTIPQAGPPLDKKVKRFEVANESLVDGIAKPSQLPIGLHFGVEEILGDTFSDPIARNVRFTLDLQNKTIGEILDALCQSDLRYMWSVDGATINVYSRSIVGDASYLLNRQLKRITLDRVPDPEHALTPLDRQLPPPREQLGYSGVGGNSIYVQPWSIAFEDLAVRQFINRIAEHMGPRTSWFWKGTKKERFFSFIKEGVHTETKIAISMNSKLFDRKGTIRFRNSCFALERLPTPRRKSGGQTGRIPISPPIFESRGHTRRQKRAPPCPQTGTFLIFKKQGNVPSVPEFPRTLESSL